MEKSTASYESVGGTTVLKPNIVRFESAESVTYDNRIYEGFYVSYNNYDADIYGCDTTAIVLGQMQVFWILNGDHVDGLIEAIRKAGFKGCLEYYDARPEQHNRFSDRKCENHVNRKMDDLSLEYEYQGTSDDKNCYTVVRNLSKWDTSDYNKRYLITVPLDYDGVYYSEHLTSDYVTDVMSDDHDILKSPQDTEGWYVKEGFRFETLLKYLHHKRDWIYEELTPRVIRLEFTWDDGSDIKEFLIYAPVSVSDDDVAKSLENAHEYLCQEDETDYYGTNGRNPESLVAWVCDQNPWLYSDKKDVDLRLD